MTDLAAELDHINQLILGATRLGFADDVAHWKAERKRIIAEHYEPEGRA